MNLKKNIITAITLIFFTTLIFSFGFSSGVITLDVKKNNEDLNLQFNVKSGYGVQKDGPHEIALYEIDRKYAGKDDLIENIKTKGKLIKKYEKIKFSGKTAREDKKYYSELKTYSLKVSYNRGKALVILARIYYCSFENNFCSVESIQEAL